MRFTKIEGLGNDYIYLDCMRRLPSDLPRLAVCLSDRHFGVGADGIICVCPGQTGDFTMEMYNADGSRGAMCGNGIRGLGKYVYERGLTRKRCLTIDTDAGPRAMELRVRGEAVEEVTVNMGKAVVGQTLWLKVSEERLPVTPVFVGNPHAVLFAEQEQMKRLGAIGPILECHPDLPERSNVELVQMTGADELTIQVWERGSGITLACGTGACAAFAAARRKGLCGKQSRAILPGGVLILEEKGEELFLTGPARRVFEGEMDIDGLDGDSPRFCP